MKEDAATVSKFDLIVICLLSLSALIGCVRGAVREVMTVLAFVLGVFAALLGVKWVGPAFHHVVHPGWAANGLAMLAIFLVVYVGVRLLVSRMADGVRHIDSVSLVDRLLGLGFGLARGLLLLGAFQLLMNAAMPGARKPDWLTGAALYPLAVDSGHTLALLAPQGSAMAKKLAPTVERAVAESPDTRPSDQYQEKPQ
ncbi:MAG TPA: CvpA family protein [Caulobacteraceae bacterium]|nr:CvpA family protein [Caulobacteraceae bacterium]